MIRIALLLSLLAVAAQAETYGPFYPATVTQEGGGAAWVGLGNAAGTPNLAAATATLTGEGVTRYIVATDYDLTGLPAGKTVRRVYQVFGPSFVDQGFNQSDALLRSAVLGELDASGWPTGGQGEFDCGEPSNTFKGDPTFGFAVSLYSSGPGTVVVDSLAIYFDVD